LTYRGYANTIFKRLYWSGFQGRFAAFRWPCGYLKPPDGHPLIFNQSEFYAHKSATAFRKYVNYLKSAPRYAGYSINVFAHSQGGVVTSEALKQGLTVDNVILTQVAVAAHSYDTHRTRVPLLDKFEIAENVLGRKTPFFEADGGYDGQYANLPANIVNFFNPDDFALSSGTVGNWEQNHVVTKPSNFGVKYWLYDPNLGGAKRGVGTTLESVTDLDETRSMIARTRSKPVGSHPGVGGSVIGEVDLRGRFGFSTPLGDHSAQCNRSIQNVLPYFREMLVQFALP
jgi:hypothetical protein